jgi:hypothetical protein
MPRKRKVNWARRVEEIEFEEDRQASAKRREREDRLDAAKEKQIRENRKKERTVIWRGGRPAVGTMFPSCKGLCPKASGEF